MSEILFRVSGTPIGKGRPKFSTFNGRATAYTPAKTVNYENLVKLSYQQQCNKSPFEKDIPLSADIIAYFPIPKSASKKKAEAMMNGDIYPTKKPDCDNIAKIILDALNSIAYYDDSQIVRLSVHKQYGPEPCVVVHIIEMEDTKW